ncbi:ATP-binding protein [Flavobacterium akiainvivens]|uniref:ATP-binding protein n=1 Tax=Flavobacterium akiainvivens TaxID=1202724 RepID=A0A0M9VHK6_9FLAO|nr:RecQ family ATP-dependent DNA helicase [Flavobacterium akiainvivens]KOS05666.1 ATP-binding protein [Flavobacterium akiainvivens]SFQ36303.1 ATP-dependent DNA helicase RecQ [Flavobacterium akiainvivens]
MLINGQNNTRSITFIDTEIESNKGKILDIGAIKADGNHFHKPSLGDFTQFLRGSEYVCGHNILNHDIKYVGNAVYDAGIDPSNIIDTLYLSPLLFPTKPYHALLKDDKLQTEDTNNPLNDSIKARDLFNDEVAAFYQTDEKLKEIFYLLLVHTKEFGAFFRFVNYRNASYDAESLIRLKFGDTICSQADLPKIISEHPIELAYCLSLINSFITHKKVHSITPAWVLKNYPEVERIMLLLRSKPCVTGCTYCNSALDIYKGLKKFFGFNSYRTYGGQPLQEKAVKAAVNCKSVLAVFPTGGGKSITFQVPALMSAENSKGLTVVISPLQSLMKDQVDNLEKNGITEAVTINGLLDPIERAKSFERIEDGSASILYISPESLRSKSIEKLILGRKVARFVIDEAHCFSSWGQDFRVDYLYIGDFIKLIQEKKNLEDGIPVSCFTATAKQKVIEDICYYFSEKLSLDLEVFTSKASRTNLKYEVFEKQNDDKYITVRDLIEVKNCPTIIYVSRTRKAYLLAEQLVKDGFSARPYHGKMDKQEKTENQDAFLNGETQIMVATSAFGMGVDKKDVGLVIHYEISDSLENYVQEAGRAGRDENISADCFVLFNEEDLSKHFILLNQTKLSIKEIQQVWKAIKDITRFRSKVSNSALEIARKAGWDDNVVEIETRVTTAIAALEDAGYLKRGQNMPRVFANSILSKNAQEAIDKINASEKFEEKQKEQGVRIIKKLFSSKSRKENSTDVAESRVDYISEHLGIVTGEVINVVNLLREENILADAKDLTAFIKKTDNKNRSLAIVEAYSKIENFLLPVFKEDESNFHLKELNEAAEKHGCDGVNVNRIKTILNFWSIKNWIKRKNLEFSKNHIALLCLQNKAQLKEKLEKRHELATFIVEFFYDKTLNETSKNQGGKDEVLVEFSVHEVKAAYDNSFSLFKKEINIDDVEDTLFYLSRIEAIKIEGGFLVVYNRLTIERTEQDNKKRYTKDDYQKLNQFYESKVQQIHIVGEYAQRMITDYRNALQFVEDYFQLNYSSFLNKYFRGSRQNEIKRNITPAKFRQLFGELSPTQLKIINDKETPHIVVAAGPGSGKTKVLVHKLASLLLMEDVKHEQLLMLTFSRAAATEFKKRLLKLIGNAANFIEIKTFHSYCFDLLGKVGTLEKSANILNTTVERIKNGDVEASKITKTVLVIDEAQDMNAEEFALITALMEQNEEMRVIAVGDDDQNIYEFRGASAKYLEQFIYENKAVKHELVENYRSKSNLVAFSNQFVQQIQHRLKETPIVANQSDNGKIKVVRYQSNNLITPLVTNIATSYLSGTTCIITKTNEEAIKVTGLLLKNGIQAKLIQSNDSFNLYNLVEVRFLLNKIDVGADVYTITDEVWDNAKRELNTVFRNSNKLEICLNIIKDFEATNPYKKYKSDLEVLIRESKLEDFYNHNGDTIFVSTIHKAKGKEFDNVFLLLENINPASDETKRQLYVAITRAKVNLNIHLNGNYLNHLSAENLERIDNLEHYPAPDKIAVHTTLKDVWLDYFNNKQHLISQLLSGDNLRINADECLNANGQSVLKFSKSFLEKIEEMKSKHYELKSVRVNFILYWLKEGSAQEIRIILPELYFEKAVN